MHHLTPDVDPNASAIEAGPRASEPAMVRDVRRGLAMPQKELPPKYFYDRVGSELFEEITRLPEYYLTRAERALLDAQIAPVIDAVRPVTLVELGAGSAEKTRLVLDAMRRRGTARTYVPIDVSAEFLGETAVRLQTEYPGLEVRPLIADISEDFALPNDLPAPALIAFLGSTIGNFDPPSAVALLKRVRRAMGPFDRFLMGADLRKDVERIARAYNDARGVTAAFNKNVLNVVNRELGADFDLAAFDHLAFYERVAHRIEMHLVSRHAQSVTIPSIGAIDFAEGESIRTEISCKYDRESIAAMLACAGMSIERWMSDADETFALVVAGPVASDR
jgi:L-histidine Nalpha-methyltransferase